MTVRLRLTDRMELPARLAVLGFGRVVRSGHGTCAFETSALGRDSGSCHIRGKLSVVKEITPDDPAGSTPIEAQRRFRLVHDLIHL